MSQVTVYTKPKCIKCEATKRHLKRRGIPFVEKLLEGDDLDAAKKLGYFTAPVVFTDHDHWNDYRPDRIDALLKDNDNEQAS